MTAAPISRLSHVDPEWLAREFTLAQQTIADLVAENAQLTRERDALAMELAGADEFVREMDRRGVLTSDDYSPGGYGQLVVNARAALAIDELCAEFKAKS